MADRRIRSQIIVPDILSDTEEIEIKAPEPSSARKAGKMTDWYISGTKVSAPTGAVLMTAQTHPVLGCLSAQFQVRQTAGDGRPGDGETYTWRRDTSDIPVAAAPEQPAEGPSFHSRPTAHH